MSSDVSDLLEPLERAEPTDLWSDITKRAEFDDRPDVCELEPRGPRQSFGRVALLTVVTAAVILVVIAAVVVFDEGSDDQRFASDGGEAEFQDGQIIRGFGYWMPPGSVSASRSADGREISLSFNLVDWRDPDERRVGGIVCPPKELRVEASQIASANTITVVVALVGQWATDPPVDCPQELTFRLDVPFDDRIVELGGYGPVDVRD